MEALGITASALGITGFALSSIDKLHELIVNLTEAKEVLHDITSNLEAVQRPLAALKDLRISDSETYATAKKDLEKTGVAEAVNRCGQACADFTEKLKQWTKHSSSTKLSLRDRLSVGVWNKEKICTFRTQIQSCQAVVHFAIGSTQLIIQLRSEHASKTDREELKKQLQILEKAIQEHLNETKKQQDRVQKRKEELQKEPEDEEDDGAQRNLAIIEVEEQSRLLEANQVSSKDMSSMLKAALEKDYSGSTASQHVEFSGSHNEGSQVGFSSGTISNTFGKRT